MNKTRSAKTQAPYISVQHEPLKFVTRYGQRSRQANSGVTPKVRRQDNNSWQQTRRVNKTTVTQNNLSPNDAELGTSPIGLFVSPPSQCISHPPDASHMLVELEDRRERDGSVDNVDHEESNIETQKQLCDVTEIVVVQEEDVQQFGDDQTERTRDTESIHSMPTTDGVVFEHDLNKCCVIIDWIPIGLNGSNMKMTRDNVERWPEADHLRYGATDTQCESSHPCLQLQCNPETRTWFVWQV